MKTAPAYCQIGKSEAGEKLQIEGNKPGVQSPSSSALSNAEQPGYKSNLREIDNLLEPEEQCLQTFAAAISGKLEMTAGSKYRTLKNLSVVEVHVANLSNQAIVVEAGNAMLIAGTSRRKCASMAAIEETISTSASTRHKYIKNIQDTVTSFASIGAVPSVKDQILESKPVRERYGADEMRREKELSHFRNRILFPGEKTSGRIYFDGPVKEGKIELTVRNFNNSSDSTTITAVLH